MRSWILIGVAFQISWYTMSWAQSDYSDVREDQKMIYLFEPFDTQTAEWRLDKKAYVSDGKLTIKKCNVTRNIDLDFTRSFEIETLVASNYDQGYFQIKLGNWVIEIAPKFLERKATSINMVNTIRIMQDGSWGDAYGGTDISKVNLEKNKFCKYTIRKTDNLYYIFINEVLAETFMFLPFKEIGFHSRFATLEVDSYRISYLDGLENIAAKFRPSGIAVAGNSGNAAMNDSHIRPGGKYFALVIGVSDYVDDRLDLDKPARDAQQLAQVLVNNYSFTDSTITLLIDPTRQNILLALYALRKAVSPNDNLLIFYAGHGFWDEDAKQGYWWGRDASANDPSNWLSNSDLREQIRSIKSAHTLLISDACFSGGIFRSRSANVVQNASLDIQMLYKLPSRRAITSGTMTSVPDNSVFFEYLLKRLRDNPADFMTSQQLFDSFRQAVINNSMVVPQDGVIAEAGDEGGDFVFVKRKE